MFIACFTHFVSIPHSQNDTMAEEEKQDEMCDICGGTPCDWEVYGHKILEDITEMYADEESSQVENRTQVDNRTIRKSAYKLFV